MEEMLEMIALPGYGDRRGEPVVGRPAAARGAGPRADPEAQGVVLDEPLGALDKQLREQMQLELRSFKGSWGSLLSL